MIEIPFSLRFLRIPFWCARGAYHGRGARLDFPQTSANSAAAARTAADVRPGSAEDARQSGRSCPQRPATRSGRLFTADWARPALVKGLSAIVAAPGRDTPHPGRGAILQTVSQLHCHRMTRAPGTLSGFSAAVRHSMTSDLPPDQLATPLTSRKESWLGVNGKAWGGIMSCPASTSARTKGLCG